MVRMKTIAVGEFKATCLAVMAEVARSREPLEVTKRGQPLVRLVPARGDGREPRSIFGAAKDTIIYLAPDEELFSTGAVWDAPK